MGKLPVELMFIRSRMDLLKPNISTVTHDFQEEVNAKNFLSQGLHWQTGHNTKFTGPVSVEVQLEGGSLVKQHF